MRWQAWRVDMIQIKARTRSFIDLGAGDVLERRRAASVAHTTEQTYAQTHKHTHAYTHTHIAYTHTLQPRPRQAHPAPLHTHTHTQETPKHKERSLTFYGLLV